MYPYFRAAYSLVTGHFKPKAKLTDTLVTTHRAWPWDTDMFMELNNGRILTLFELGRWPTVFQFGIARALWRSRIAFAIAGVSVRYRKRIPLMAKYTMVTKFECWDDRFIYANQTMWLGRDCANQMLIRIALRSPTGTITPDAFLTRAGMPQSSPPMPGWIAAWIEADKARPWPPIVDVALAA